MPIASCSISIPGVGVEWPFVIDTALELRRLLEEEGFATWPKVTGGKGLHIMAPLRGRDQPR